MRATDDDCSYMGHDEADLDDVGLPGYTAATGIGPDGDFVFLLACRAAYGTDAPICPLDWRDVAPHELLGPLPRRFKRDHGVLICGRPARTTGKPCRNTVDRPGDACPWHATVVRR
jgi:hypothetical protein